MPYSLALRCPDGRSQHEDPPDDNGKAKPPFDHVFTRMAYLLREKTYLFKVSTNAPVSHMGEQASSVRAISSLGSSKDG